MWGPRSPPILLSPVLEELVTPCPSVSLTLSWYLRRPSPWTADLPTCVCKQSWVGVGLGWTERSSARNVPVLFLVSSPPFAVQSCHLPPALPPPCPPPKGNFCLPLNKWLCHLQDLAFLSVEEREDSLLCSTPIPTLGELWKDGEQGQPEHRLAHPGSSQGPGFLLPTLTPVPPPLPLQALRLCGPEAGQHHRQCLPPLCRA